MEPNEVAVVKSPEVPRSPFGGRLLRGGLILLVVIVAGLALGKIWWNSTFFEGYEANLPLNSQVVEKKEVNGHIRERITFQGTAGEQVPAVFHYPKDSHQPFPCLVLLYGIGQDLRFLDEIAEPYVQAGIGIICPEQLGRGERKDRVAQKGLKSLLSFKQRLSTTVADGRRTVDYLWTRPEVDPNQLVLFGVSLGAIMGTTVLAIEPRYSAGLLMWGGGDIQRVFSENRAVREAKFYQKLLLRLGYSFLSPAEPINRIALISPRPLLFQNALHDEIIPKVCTEAYFEKAEQPKEILWYDCGHEKGLNQELIFKIIGDQITWLKKVQGETTG